MVPLDWVEARPYDKGVEDRRETSGICGGGGRETRLRRVFCEERVGCNRGSYSSRKRDVLSLSRGGRKLCRETVKWAHCPVRSVKAVLVSKVKIFGEYGMNFKINLFIENRHYTISTFYYYF